MSNQSPALPRDAYSLPATILLFFLGGLVTSVFSGSLVKLTSKASFVEVLSIGMIVPSFTWLVHLFASLLCMSPIQRRKYWGDLGRICLLGSLALLPASIFNCGSSNPPAWISAANVLISVAVMSVALFRLSRAHGQSLGWPISWTLTIILNMTLFVLSSWSWW